VIAILVIIPGNAADIQLRDLVAADPLESTVVAGDAASLAGPGLAILKLHDRAVHEATALSSASTMIRPAMKKAYSASILLLSVFAVDVIEV
jgi:hypothetical protein